jgi:signal transduction histidine kinase/ligand-binding sensor domain-containing protein
MKCWCLFFVAFWALGCFGQPPEHSYVHLGTRDGLSTNSVHCIMQDHQGFIWIGTENGLQKYDGRKFTTYHRAMGTSNGLVSDNIEKLFEDRKGVIWIATTKGVCVYDTKLRQFGQVPIIGIDEGTMTVRCFGQDKKGAIWLGTLHQGTYSYDTGRKIFSPAFADLSGFRWKTRLVVEDDKHGWYWLGCDSGLAVFDIASHAIYTKDNNPLNIAALGLDEFYHNAVYSMLLDSNNIWALTWKYQARQYHNFRFNVHTGKLVTYNLSTVDQRDFWQDSRGNIWLYDYIYELYMAGGDSFYEVPSTRDRNGIDYTTTCQPLEDREGNKWIGTDKGIYIVNQNCRKILRAKLLPKKAGKLTNSQILDFLALPDGKLYAATWGGGVFVFDSDMRQLEHWEFSDAPPDPRYKLIWSLFAAPDSRIWMGCQSGRIVIYDPRSRQFSDALCKKTILSMDADENGDLWFGTHGNTIARWDHASNVFVNYDSIAAISDRKGVVKKLIADKKGNIWVATSNTGLLQLDVSTGKQRKHYLPGRNDRNSLLSANVTSAIDNDSLLILGTSDGIDILNKRRERFRHITTADGLPNNYVYSMNEDSKGNIWVNLFDGIAKVAHQKNENVFYRYDDGILADVQLFASSKIVNNKMIIGNNDGFVYFQTDSLSSPVAPPGVEISRMLVLDSEINLGPLLSSNMPLRLDHAHNFISIEFSAPSYFNNDLIYFYQMEGIDNDWVKADLSQATKYSNLPAGHLVFKVMCVNNGIRSEHITALHIIVDPPFWKTWWFIFISVMVLYGIAFGIHYLRVRRMLAMERVRERIALDLHDDMGSTLSTIKILSEMARMKVKVDIAKTEEFIGKISDNSTRMMEAMDDIVWSINPSNDNMQKIIARMREYAASTLEPKDIDYQFQTSEHINEIALKMDTRKDLFLIYKEALNNLAKYSKCTRASIEMNITNSILTMKIQDNGVGFDIERSDNGNGLTSMRKRASSIKGVLTIDSKVNVGTKLSLEMNLT